MIRLQLVSLVAAPVLAALHKAAFATHADWDQAFFEKLLQLPTTRGWLALDNDLPVGFILWQQTAEMGEVISIAVAPEDQCRGLGRQLLDAYEAMLRDDGALESVLDVAEDNLAALRLYGGAGYQKIHYRPNYYQHYVNGQESRIAALVLQKKLI